MLRKNQIAIYIVLGGALSWFVYSKFTSSSRAAKSQSKMEVSEVNLLTTSKMPITKTLTFAGFIANRKLIQLRTERSGQIRYLNESPYCKEGSVLIELVNDYEKASVTRQEAQLKKAKAALDRYTFRVKRTPESASDNEQLNYETDYEIAKSELGKARSELAKTILKAPFDGQMGITRYGVEKGGQVNPNDVICSYASRANDLVVDFVVSEQDVNYVKVGKEVILTAMVAGKPTFLKGIIEKIDTGSDSSYAIRIRAGIVYDPGVPISPGFSVKILCDSEDTETMTVVNDRAIKEYGDRQFVFTCVPTAEEGVYLTQQVEVRTGQRSGSFIAVNLPPDIKYTTDPVRDGARVKGKM